MDDIVAALAEFDIVAEVDGDRVVVDLPDGERLHVFHVTPEEYAQSPEGEDIAIQGVENGEATWTEFFSGPDWAAHFVEQRRHAAAERR